MKAAFASEKQWQSVFREAGMRGRLRCRYLGQESALTPGEFEPDPFNFDVPRGERRPRAALTFQWILPFGGRSVVRVLAYNAVDPNRGVPFEGFDSLLL